MDKEIAVVYVGDDEKHNAITDLYFSDRRKVKKLSKRTLKSIEAYTKFDDHASGQPNHILINKVIEGFVTGSYKFPVFPKGIELDAFLINKALKNSLYSSAEFLYKGIKRDREVSILKDKKIGDDFSFANFVSTSYSDAAAKAHAEKDIILKISNSFGLPLNNPIEIEFLLPAQSRFKVVDIKDEIWGDEFGNQEISVIQVMQF